MPRLPGGLRFEQGRPIVLTSPPPTLPAQVLRLTCPERPELVTGHPVKRGQLLLRPVRESRACHISPIQGTIRRVIPWRGPKMAERELNFCFDVMIEPDEQTLPTHLEIMPPADRELDSWLTALRQVGPWTEADGKVGLVAQLRQAKQTPPRRLICVGLDDFPPLPSRSSLLLSFPEDLVRGIRLLADVTGVGEVSLLMPRVKAIVERLKHNCQNASIKPVICSNVYPNADPTVIAWKHADKTRLADKQNPVECGLLIVTAWTAIRIGRWLRHERLDLVRPLLLSWPEPDVPLTGCWAFRGQPLAGIDERLAQVVQANPERVIFGNPLTGRQIVTPTVDGRRLEPVVPEDEQLITVRQPGEPPHPEPCIHCGDCVEVCPTRLQPIELVTAGRLASGWEEIGKQLNWCIQCGLCSYICPTFLPLGQELSAMKDRFDNEREASRLTI